jgi:hypothetical protein
MLRLGVLLIFLATALSASAEDWVTADGKTYKNVVIIAQEGDGVRVTYEGGVGKLPYYELPDDVVRRLGQDPAALAIKRAAFVKEQAEAALKAKQDAAAAAELKRQADEAAAVAAALNPNQAPATNANGQPVAPGAIPAPNAAPGSASTVTPGGVAPQNSATAQNPASATNSATAQTPAASTNAVPGQAAAQNAAQAQGGSPQPNFVPAHSQPPVAPPPPVATTSDSSGPADEQASFYPNSKFQYDEGADISYLDSPPVQVVPVVLDSASPATGAAPVGPASLSLRIKTEGRRAETPDEVQGIFISNMELKKLAANHKVKFLVDGAYIQATPPLDPAEDNEATTDPQVTRVNFFLTPEQMKTILSGKQVNLSVGGYDYRIDDAGIATFRAFLGDVNHLPPASTNMVRMYHRLLNRLPSIITMISTACEYIILSAFGIVVVASIAAFIMGLTRFIKM